MTFEEHKFSSSSKDWHFVRKASARHDLVLKQNDHDAEQLARQMKSRISDV